MVTARAATDTAEPYDLTSSIPYNPYSYSIPDYYSFPTYSYSIPSYSIPSFPAYSYSIPSYSFDIPTYSWTAPSITVPDVSYPTSGGGGSGGGSGNKNTDPFPEIASTMKKINWKKIGGAIAGSVVGFFSLLGGLWAGCKRKMCRGKRRGNDTEKYAGTSYGPVPTELGGVGTLPHQQPSGHGRFGSTVHEPLLPGGYYAQVSLVFFFIVVILTAPIASYSVPVRTVYTYNILKFLQGDIERFVRLVCTITIPSR